MKRFFSIILLFSLLCLTLCPIQGEVKRAKQASFYMDNLYIQSFRGQLGKWKINSSVSTYAFAKRMGTTLTEVKKINQGKTSGVVFVPMGLSYFDEQINKGHGRRQLSIDNRQLSWPLEQVYYTSRFGPRGKTMHTGLDIGCGIGTPVLAADDGVVSHSANFGALGNAVAIYHANGTRTWYGHNSQLVLKVGENVKRGQIIAFSGNTGRSTGPHVHFEVRYMDVVMNPEDFLIPSYSRPNLVQLESSPVEITEETTFTITQPR